MPKTGLSSPLFGSEPKPKPDGLRDTLRVFRRHRRGLTAWLGFCVAIAVFYLMITPSEFVATTQLLLDSRSLPQAEANINSTLGTIDTTQVDSQVQIARSERVLRFVFSELKLANDPEFADIQSPGLMTRLFSTGKNTPSANPPANPRDEVVAFVKFSDHVTARRIGQSLVLEISFRSLSAERAAKMANSIAASFLRYQLRVRALETLRGGDWLQSRLDDLGAQEKATVDAVRNGVAPANPLMASPVQIIGEATEPLRRTYPQKGLVLFSSFVFALLTGFGFVSIKDGLDRSIRSRPQLHDEFGLECLGTTPYDPQVSFASATALTNFLRTRPDAGFSRSIDAIVSALLSSRNKKAPRVIGVVSQTKNAGSSTIAAALALQFAARGCSTALADVSANNSDHLWRLDSTRAGEGALPAKVSTARNDVRVEPNLQLIDLVTLSAKSRENVDLKHASAASKLGDYLLRFDHVVIGFPALTSSSSALSHAALLDGVIVVVEYGKTSSGELDDVAHAFDLTDTPIFGVVINKAPEWV
jgi:Mrp family chromosome partitioning ATPase/capsular polysaccharide biosynthesis protein